MGERTNTERCGLDWRRLRQTTVSSSLEPERFARVTPAGGRSAAARGAPQQQLPARVRDMTLGGFVLEAGRPFNPGELLTVEVTGPGATAAPSLLARVLHALQGRDGTWDLSCCFAKELTEDELQAFGAQPIRPDNNDGRAWVRFPCRGETVFHSVLSARQERLTGKVVNISAGGVGLLATQELEAGTLLGLELHGPEGHPPRPVQARVVHATGRPEGGWLLGCTLVGELEDESIHLLAG